MKKIILVILLLSSSSALAEWIYLTQNKLGSSFVDFKGIKKIGSHRKAWTFIVFNEKQQESALSMKTYDEFDCANAPPSMPGQIRKNTCTQRKKRKEKGEG